MADELTDIDLADDFEELAVGLEEVTVRQIDPDTGATVTADGVAVEVSGVPAAVLTRTRGGDTLPSDTRRVVFSSRRLGFTPKQRDEVERDNGEVWAVESVEVTDFDNFCHATCVRKRS